MIAVLASRPPDIVDQSLVGDHHALGPPRRPRRVHDIGEITRPGRNVEIEVRIVRIGEGQRDDVGDVGREPGTQLGGRYDEIGAAVLE